VSDGTTVRAARQPDGATAPGPARHTGRDHPALPRSQVGASPQHLLTTLLGDYWLQRSEHLPSAALVELLGEFGVGPTGARAALNRLGRRGLLVTSKSGRNTYYGIAPGVPDMLAAGAYQFVSFGRTTPPWDGLWTIAAFSLPESRRELRYPLRSRLRWLGFAPLYDGMWVSPRPVAGQAVEVLAELGLDDATVLRACEVAGDGRHPVEAWNLDELATMYRDFADTYGELGRRMRLGRVGTTEALVARTRLIDGWRTFPGLDPDVPAELLPDRWPRARAHQVFVEVYDGLGALAAIRVRQIFEHFSAELAALVAPHTTEFMLRTGEQVVRRGTATTTSSGAARQPGPGDRRC
jgi:phenylacetic acid degradation operon negative regulatory protein